MTFVDVVEISKPAPDSHYRLQPCSCGSSEVVYARYNVPHRTGSAVKTTPAPDMWRVVCTDCGATVDLQGTIKHDVQVEWNRRQNHG